MNSFRHPILLDNATLLDPETGTRGAGCVLLEQGVISQINPSKPLAADTQVIDCEGHILSAGLIDLRARLGEPGFEYRETLKSASHAAVAGGITTAAVLPDTQPVIDDGTLISAIARKARLLKNAKFFCYAAATQGCRGNILTEAGLLKEGGAIALTDAGNPIASSKQLALVLRYAKTQNLPLVQQPLDPDLRGDGVANSGVTACEHGLDPIPTYAEALMLARDLRIVAACGARYHASLLTTAESVDLIRQAKAEGLDVTADTAPQYFCLTDQAVADYRTYAKLMPPLKGETDRQAVLAGVVDGTIDWIVSDHTPMDAEEKLCAFADAGFGSVGFATLLPMTLTLYHQGWLSLAETLALLTSKPAQFLPKQPAVSRSSPSVGSLQPGSPADLVLFDPEAEVLIRDHDLIGQAYNTVFDGITAKGIVMKTIVDGRIVYEHASDSHASNAVQPS